ncbi:MAG: ParB/RepB/Spo0J family partition protein [Bacteroidales bacterium]|nr:ParB/RepB/Spo0J family partition protein [Bacteroidales bacterium]MBQ7018004.1 ParB/RepB/Spo0J family partition protein [Bacteroidales bacterium]MBR2478108.1 ParB/RepB/Spo0J family partition protein [Bacteroidales bacterium]
MAKIQTGLGRGLGALISDVNSIQQAAHKPLAGEPARPLVSTSEIEISKIEPNPYQPRTEFNQEALEELSASIKLLGLIQPITVRPLPDGRYQIISGERRFRASQMAGLATIPAYIRKTDDQGMLEMAIVENIQREDLDSIEVALSFQRLIEECNLTQEAMAERVGKKRATVTNYLRLLRLPAEIQFAIRAKKISMGHAKALLALETDKEQLKFANQIIEQDLSVRQIEQKIQNLGKKREKKEKEEPVAMELPDSHFRVIEIIGKYFNNNVTARRDAKGSGEISIRFSNDSEMEAFLQALEKLDI